MALTCITYNYVWRYPYSLKNIVLFLKAHRMHSKKSKAKVCGFQVIAKLLLLE